MKNKKIRYWILIALIIGTLGCDDFLSEAPDNRQEIQTLEDIQKLLVSAYSEGSYIFLEWKTDNVEAISDNRQKQWLDENFKFQEVKSEDGQDSPPYCWMKNYYAIAHANQALASLKEVVNTDPKLWDAIKGEALITRAYHHFILATIFCQDYDPATATSQLGIPYIEKPEDELIRTYSRATLKETYEKVQRDLEEGLSLLTDKYYVGSGKYHFNKQAAYAFASRFYLFYHIPEKCIEYASKLLGRGKISSMFFRDMEQVFEGKKTEEIAAKFANAEDPANLLLVRKETSIVTRHNYGARSSYKIFEKVFDENIQGTYDYRNERWKRGTDARFQPKYGEYFRYTSANRGYRYYIHPELRSEEVIFNRMEAYVATGQWPEALADYNRIAPSRYSSGGQLTIEEIKQYYDLSNPQEAMMLFVLDERRKEFFGEALRWWDIKRFKLSVTHIDLNENEHVLQADDLRKAEQIPSAAIINGLEANPR